MFFIAKNKKSRSISKVSIQTDEEIVKTYGKVIIKVVSIKTVVNHPLALRYLDVKTDVGSISVKESSIWW